MLAEHDCWILSDEVYSELLYDARRTTRSPSHEGLLERTILLDGFSKTFAMTGWRLGYAALPAELVEPITRLFDQLRLLHGARRAARRRRRARPGPRDEVDAMSGRVPPRRDARRRRA